MTASLPSMMRTATRPGSSSFRRFRTTKPMPSAWIRQAMSISADRSPPAASARARRRKAAAMPMSPSSIPRATSSTKSSSAPAARIRFRPPPRPPTAACMSRASRTAMRSFRNTPTAMPRLRPSGKAISAICRPAARSADSTVSGNQLYVSGTTQNGNLTAGGAATVANASSSGTDAFVFNLTDSGSSATPDFVSYVGTGSTDKGGAVTVGSDGTIYLTGSTTGTFAGQNRNVASVSNQFAAVSDAQTAASTGHTSSAASTDNRQAPASPSTQAARAFWMHSACRAAPSRSTSRSI